MDRDSWARVPDGTVFFVFCFIFHLRFVIIIFNDLKKGVCIFVNDKYTIIVCFRRDLNQERQNQNQFYFIALPFMTQAWSIFHTS